MTESIKVKPKKAGERKKVNELNGKNHFSLDQQCHAKNQWNNIIIKRCIKFYE